MKKLLAALIFLSFITLIAAACSRGTSTGSIGDSASTVHMSDLKFVQSSITISKGSTLTLVDDSATPHIIANGSWMNGNAEPMQEHGMPAVNNVQISGSGRSQTIGPFTMTGTFHLYCIVHPEMNLTVIVQ